MGVQYSRIILLRSIIDLQLLYTVTTYIVVTLLNF